MLQRFFKSESGAITADWVVITASVVGLGLAAYAVVGHAVDMMVLQIVGWLVGAETCMAGGSVSVFIGGNMSQVC
jgi:hypothetical protein